MAKVMTKAASTRSASRFVELLDFGCIGMIISDLQGNAMGEDESGWDRVRDTEKQ